MVEVVSGPHMKKQSLGGHKTTKDAKATKVDLRYIRYMAQANYDHSG
jgi:hypothetical protein